MIRKHPVLISILIAISLMTTSCSNGASKADYYIDYENGTIPLGDLPIGARVVDPSWEWEYRLGINYGYKDWGGDPTPPGEIKPVVWIVVAKDHYDLDETHVTLLSEELIGIFVFDDSTDRIADIDDITDWISDIDDITGQFDDIDEWKERLLIGEWGHNHWGESGTGNASHGLRPWLNSTGIHSGEGFYQVFSESFKNAVLTTAVPNKEWQNGIDYITNDQVFIPSNAELGDILHFRTYPIGNPYPYFSEAGNKKRIAMMAGDSWDGIVEKEWGFMIEIEDIKELKKIKNGWYYCTRSPDSDSYRSVKSVYYDGGLNPLGHTWYFGGYPGVRPALNLKSGILVSEIKN